MINNGYRVLCTQLYCYCRISRPTAHSSQHTAHGAPTMIPRVLDKVIVGNDTDLLAQLSCVAARARCYLPILNCPPSDHPNFQSTITARSNCVASIRPDQIFLAGLWKMSLCN